MEDCENGIAQVTAQVERLARETAEATQDLKPEFLQIPGDAKKRFVIFNPITKSFTTEEPIPGYVNALLETPADLLEYIKDAEEGSESDAAIYYSESGIIYIPDVKDRRDRATCPLKPSAVWQLLASNGGNGPNPLPQKAFVRLLRVTLNGCISEGNPLLNIVREIKFTQNGQYEGKIQHGNESLGKAITNQALGLSDIPDELRLMVRVFDNFGHVAPINCAVEIMPEDMTFKLSPYPLVMKLAMDEALERVAEVFEANDMPPIYRGNPGT